LEQQLSLDSAEHSELPHPTKHTQSIWVLPADRWQQYTLIDAGDGEKLEQWGEIILRRPEATAIWPRNPTECRWNQPHARFLHSSTSARSWLLQKACPSQWQISYGRYRFHIRLGPFKHTGLFPEQASNWDWIYETISSAKRSPEVLHLFAYTGAATVAAAAAGAAVCHVDASKSIVRWARENLELNGLAHSPVRWIVDDAQQFLQREHRRRKKYDAIILDPPSYGCAGRGRRWKFELHILTLLQSCARVLSDNPLFVLISSHTTGYSPLLWPTLLEASGFKGKIQLCQLALRIISNQQLLPCGYSVRWQP